MVGRDSHLLKPADRSGEKGNLQQGIREAEGARDRNDGGKICCGKKNQGWYKNHKNSSLTFSHRVLV